MELGRSARTMLMAAAPARREHRVFESMPDRIRSTAMGLLVNQELLHFHAREGRGAIRPTCRLTRSRRLGGAAA